MAKNRKQPKVKKIKQEEVLTSRLMAGILYFFFYAFVILIVSNSVGSSFVRISGWFVLFAALLFGAALVYFIRKRKAHVHEHLKVNSSAYLLSVATTLLLSLSCIALFGNSGGYWYSIILPAIVCFLYFLYIAYRPWVLTLCLFSFVLFGLTFATQISLFNLGSISLARILFSAFLTLLAFSLAALIYRLKAKEGVIFLRKGTRTLLAITGAEARYYPFFLVATAFTAGLVLRYFFPAQTLLCALSAPAFFLLFLICFSVFGKDAKRAL